VALAGRLQPGHQSGSADVRRHARHARPVRAGRGALTRGRGHHT
jgi:hypothetical protein